MSTSSSLPVVQPRIISAAIGGQANVDKLKTVARDFRTDTITIPCDGMLLAGLQASRGDDVYHEDETTHALEERIAKMCGKEAGMFVVSGTMSNQLGLRTWLTQPPHSVLCDFRSHVYKYEAGGIAFHSQASTTTMLPENGHHLTWEDDVEPNLVLGDDVHSCPTKIVSLENTLNGTIFPQDEIVKISQNVRAEGLIMHCDGARMWNVAAEAGATVETLPEVMKELCAPFDSVSLCMSKGLGAPIGSVLVGPAAFIKKARHFRKLFGGGIRQSGGLAAAANYALDNNFGELKRTHDLAKKLCASLKDLGARILVQAETSMMFYDLSPLNIDLNVLSARAASLPSPIRLGGPRLVIHLQTDPQAVDDLVVLIAEMKQEQIDQGFEPRPVNENGKPSAFHRPLYANLTSGVGSK